MKTKRPRLSLSDGGTLRDFITRIEQGIYIVTPEGGRIVDANPALLEIFGADSVQQLQRYTSEDLVVDRNVLAERRRLLAEHGWIRDFRYDIRRLDGTTRRVRDTVFTQRNDNGEIEALHGILDIIDEGPLVDGMPGDDVAADLSHLEAPLSSFFTGAPAGLAILDADLCFVRINRRLADLHVLPVEDHLGRPLGEVLPGLTPIVEPVLRQVLSTGVPALNIELATEDARTPREQRVWRFSAFPVGPVRENPTGVGVVVVDITDSRRREEQARLDGRYFAALIESCPLAMVTLDPANRVVAANAAFERLFLVAREDALGRDLDEIITTPATVDEARMLTRRTQLGERIRIDVQRRRGNGASVRVRAHSSPIVLDGQHVGASIVYEDLETARD